MTLEIYLLNVSRMIPRWAVAIRGRVPRSAALALGLVPIMVLVALWWYSTRGVPEERVLGPTILPSPAEVIDSLHDLVGTADQDNRSLFDHIFISLRRVGLGFLVALAVVLAARYRHGCIRQCSRDL